jgi:hypothetical protein
VAKGGEVKGRKAEGKKEEGDYIEEGISLLREQRYMIKVRDQYSVCWQVTHLLKGIVLPDIVFNFRAFRIKGNVQRVFDSSRMLRYSIAKLEGCSAWIFSKFTQPLSRISKFVSYSPSYSNYSKVPHCRVIPAVAYSDYFESLL